MVSPVNASTEPSGDELRHARSRAVNTLTVHCAEELIRAATEAARTLARSVAIAVVDPSGVLVAFKRMDEAPLMSVAVSQDKAYTAVGFGMSGEQWYQLLRDDEPLRLGAGSVQRLVPFGGGLPIYESGRLIGAIGISGGHHTEDARIAQEAVDAVVSGPAGP